VVTRCIGFWCFVVFIGRKLVYNMGTASIKWFCAIPQVVS
jgi:hypothetical protein